MDVRVTNGADITRIAMGLLPVVDKSDLISKLEPYKKVASSLLREIVRAVNSENQYRALKTAEFKIDKAATALCEPFNPDTILSDMNKEAVGTLKVAQIASLPFRSIKKSFYKRKKVASVAVAKKNAISLVRELKRDTSDRGRDKFMTLYQVAKARKVAVSQDIKATITDIANLLGEDVLLARKYAGAFESYKSIHLLPKNISAKKVVKWANLNERLLAQIKTKELVDYVLGGSNE